MNITEDEDLIEDDDIEFYKIVVPVLISLSMTGFILNLMILTSILASKHLIRTRETDKYLLLIISLLSSDALNSLLLASQLFCGSYLPVVQEVKDLPKMNGEEQESCFYFFLSSPSSEQYYFNNLLINETE